MMDVFRDEKDILWQVFSKKEWRKYFDIYTDIDRIILNQERNILDSEVDKQMLELICRKSRKNIYFVESEGKIFSYKPVYSHVVIPIVDAISIFNHNAIEEVFEKSESLVIRK